MNNSKVDVFSCNYIHKIGISKMLGIIFVMFVALTVVPILTENAHSQSTLYQCNHNTGINASSSNCFTNNNTPRSNNSVAMMNQTGK
jgi:hypothetical protein